MLSIKRIPNLKIILYYQFHHFLRFQSQCFFYLLKVRMAEQQIIKPLTDFEMIF